MGMLPMYVAGMDQPGDWSERQVSLFNGKGKEAGDIAGHLEKSLGIAESLKALNTEQPWYNEEHNAIALTEIGRIKKVLPRYRKNY